MNKGVHSIPKILKKKFSLLEKQNGFEKVIVGPSEAANYKYPTGHIKYVSDFPGGIKIRGYTEKGITIFYIYCNNIEEIKKFIESNF